MDRLELIVAEVEPLKVAEVREGCETCQAVRRDEQGAKGRGDAGEV